MHLTGRFVHAKRSAFFDWVWAPSSQSRFQYGGLADWQAVKGHGEDGNDVAIYSLVVLSQTPGAKIDA